MSIIIYFNTHSNLQPWILLPVCSFPPPYFLSYVHQGHFFFFLMTPIFFFPSYFPSYLALVDSTWVLCMLFGAVSASDDNFSKFHMAGKRLSVWVLWVSTEPQPTAAGISENQGRNQRWTLKMGVYGESYFGVTVGAPHI